jgi:DNA repair protein RadD
MSLRYYQKDCLERCIENVGGLCILPTGAGKSHIIAALCHHFCDKRVLVVTPRLELVKQNREKIGNDNIICVTINTAHSRNMSADILIIDECHLVRMFDGMYRNLIDRCEMVYGFTATPYRLDSGHLSPYIFPNVIYEIDRSELIDKGYLTPRRTAKIPHELLLNVNNSSFSSAAKLSADVCPKTSSCIEFFKNKTKGATLIFGCDIRHCEIIKSCCGESSAVVHGKLSKTEREKMVTDFKKGNIKYLINCNILTTGFDYPDLRNIVILRPTDSYSLYEQICGRGDRVFEGKKYNSIWDFTISSFQFGNGKPSKPKDHNRFCIFCMEITDYRLKKCSHCNKTLIKGDVPKKECELCGAKNFNCATYCNECGTFIKANVKWLRFRKFHFNKKYNQLNIEGKCFNTMYESFMGFCTDMGAKTKVFGKNVYATLDSERVLYYKYNSYKGGYEFLEVR